MAQVTSGIRSLLSSPFLYTSFQNLMGARQGWVGFVQEFVRPLAGNVILDVGCGPADILEYLPEVEYWGVDISDTYIAYAREKYGNKGRFICKLLSKNDLKTLPQFDMVVASGVLHHMDDDIAHDFLGLAHDALKPGGRLVTVDPCWAEGQHSIASFLISRDRGRNVRTKAGYENLVSANFPTQKITVRHKAWIPYTHCFMECIRE